MMPKPEQIEYKTVEVGFSASILESSSIIHFAGNKGQKEALPQTKRKVSCLLLARPRKVEHTVSPEGVTYSSARNNFLSK